jgi:hypothetical protein
MCVLLIVGSVNVRFEEALAREIQISALFNLLFRYEMLLISIAPSWNIVEIPLVVIAVEKLKVIFEMV